MCQPNNLDYNSSPSLQTRRIYFIEYCHNHCFKLCPVSDTINLDNGTVLDKLLG